jgi:hypothetical protein
MEVVLYVAALTMIMVAGNKEGAGKNKTCQPFLVFHFLQEKVRRV